MKYSIDESTLSALGEATRRFTDAFRIENNEYTSMRYRLDSDFNNSSASTVLIPIFDATSIAITKIACDPEDVTVPIYLHNCNASDWLSYSDTSKSQFTVINFLGSAWAFGLYCNEPGIIYDFEVTWLDANGEPMTVTFEEEVVNTLTPGQMVEVLETFDLGAIIPESALTLTGNCIYKFAYGGWDWFISQMGDKIITKDISSAGNMFNSSNLVNIPFVINMSDLSNSSYQQHSFSYMFSGSKIRTAPMIYGAKPSDLGNFFANSQNLTNIPANFAEDWDWSYLDGLTSSYTGSMSNMFDGCWKLRAVPQALISHGNPYWVNNSTVTYYGFRDCYCLQELVDVFIPHLASYTGSYSNAFNYAFDNCSRLKRLTFKTVDGDPLTAKSWNNQTIDLTTVGYFKTPSYATQRAGLRAADVIDSEGKWYSYQNSGGYSNWYATDVAYSVFGASAAREFFASLPQVGGTGCIIKLNPNAASAIPGEAMSSLSEEEIAIAAARGWTISLK